MLSWAKLRLNWGLDIDKLLYLAATRKKLCYNKAKGGYMFQMMSLFDIPYRLGVFLAD